MVLDPATFDVIESAGVAARARFPYVPGYLSFREIPPLLEAFAKLAEPPDLIVCDGQGRAHPRRFGLASHLGVYLDLPTIGCAKSRLVGEHREPGPRRGASTRLRREGEVIETVLRTQDGVKPLYVSVGHRVTLAAARSWILARAAWHRLPNPVRVTHAEVNRLRRESARPRSG